MPIFRPSAFKWQCDRCGSPRIRWYCRASLIAASHASEPELVRKQRERSPGDTRARRDLTETFLNEAERRGWPTVQIQTNGDDQPGWPAP